jgi:rhodanese-related sulfurtransferase
MKKQMLMLLCLLVWLPLALAEKPRAPESVEGTTRVSAEAVVELVTTLPNLVIIDSRHEEEFAKGHIEGAINLLDVHMQRADLLRLARKPDTPLLFYCNGEYCPRSANAAKNAVAWGYRRVYWFRDGWQAWTDKQLPVTR